MEKQLKRPKVLLGLLVTLALALYLVMAAPALAQPPLNGNVEIDFTGPGILIIPDSIGDVGMPGTPPGITGWDMKDLRLFYHAATDTMYVGINVQTILGDADGDGDPSVTSAYLGFPSPPGLGGADIPDLGQSEAAAVYFDLDQDGTWDVIGGISGVTDYWGFSVNVFTGPFNPPTNFGTALPGNTGAISPNPDAAHPDLEFTITNWSTLPGHDASVGFNVNAFIGSLQDAGIGEDFLKDSYGPSIDIDVEKLVSKDNVNFFDADTAGDALVVGQGDNVYFKYIVTNTGNETLTNIILSDNVHDVSGIIVTDPLAPLASFTGTIGPITALSGLQTDIATATGDWDGFTVQDTNPANYFGSGPDIDIIKEVSVNGGTTWHDANSAPGPDVLVGGAVQWRYIVENTGNVALTAVNVTDDQGVTVTCPKTTLAIGEKMTCTASGTAVNGQYTNIGTATGKPPTGPNVFATDPANYFGSPPTPDIRIEKHTNGVDADTAPGPNINIGSTVTWTYRVTNIGSVNLTGIDVTDNMPGVTPALFSGDDGNDGILEPYSQTNEMWIYRDTGTAVAGQYANIGTVVGYYGLVQVTDSDPSHYFGKTVPVVGWETYPINKLRVLLPWIALLTAIIVGTSLLVLRHRRAQS